jgi:hypothetical protein
LYDYIINDSKIGNFNDFLNNNINSDSDLRNLTFKEITIILNQKIKNIANEIDTKNLDYKNAKSLKDEEL